MTEKTALIPGSPEFGALEYQLQMGLKATTARVLDAYQLHNPHLALQFEKRAKDMLCIDSWVDAAAFGSSVDDEIVKRLSGTSLGINGQGMKFGVGQIRLESSGTPAPARTPFGAKSKANSKVVKKMVLCKVAVGRSFVMEAANASKEPIPEGYDSFHLQSAAGTQSEGHHHEYFIKDATQVLPLFLVQFEYDPVKEKLSREKPKCDNCENIYATVYCAADDANLCTDCDHSLHATSKVAQRHKRTPIGKGAEAFGHCRTHVGQKIEFFCSQCHIPVCVHCKMVGNHSSGESSKHKLVSVAEAFETVMRESQRADGVLGNRCTTIDRQVECLHQRARQVENLQSQLESELEQAYQRALMDVRKRIQHKMFVLLSDECELTRQKQEIAQLNEFLEYQRLGGDAFNMLFNWSKHQQLRQTLHESQHVREEIDVHIDLKIEGELKVAQEDAASMRRMSMSPPKFKYPAASVSTRQTPAPNHPGMGLPSKLSKRPNGIGQRRTSDLFAETLNALDDIHERSFVNSLEADERSIVSSIGLLSDK